MGPPTERIPEDRALPEHVDVAVVGGGIVGVSTARSLAEKGLSVAVFDKGHIEDTSRASSRAATGDGAAQRIAICANWN